VESSGIGGVLLGVWPAEEYMKIASCPSAPVAYAFWHWVTSHASP